MAGIVARPSGLLQAARLQSLPMLPLTPRRKPVEPTQADALPRQLPVLRLSVEALLLLGCVWFALVSNRMFVTGALKGRDWADASAWTFGAALVLGVLALHLLLLALLSNRWIVKPLLALLLVATAFASYYMQQYGVYLDPSMLRNVLRTDWHEAGELLGLSLALAPAAARRAAAAAAVARAAVTRPWKRALLVRLGCCWPRLAVLVAGAAERCSSRWRR
jgi:glucan phosphoethanolaminetransferase (alkaline phosphatase superfamily)